MKHIYKYLYILTLILAVTSCSDEFKIFNDADYDSNGELIVEFNLNWPESVTTRAGINMGDREDFAVDGSVRKKFQDGDVIHIVGRFNTHYLDEDGENYIDGEEVRYGALQYEAKSRNWKAVAGNQLTWPSVAVNGTFYAYYVANRNGVLTNDDPIQTYLLSDVTPANDPLKADLTQSIDYGHAVQLDFRHICAHLTLIDLEPMVASHYFFYRNKTNDENPVPFNNAYQFYLSQDAEGNPELKFEFCKSSTEDYGGLVYIDGNVTQTETTNEEGELVYISEAGYFLEPGEYKTFYLCYPASTEQVYDYLTYDFNQIPEHVGGIDKDNTPPILESNGSYILTITKSPGVTITVPQDSNKWDDDGESVDVDVEEFLKAVADNMDYNKDGVQILEKTPNGTRLLKNVNFKFFNYSQFKDPDFVPNIKQSSVFDGNFHYIDNLGSPLIRYNYGTIQNLGIRTAEIDVVSDADPEEFEDRNSDKSRQGALCEWNRGAATISNVRVSDVNMTVSIKTDISGTDDGSETHNTGGVVGSNTGTINELYLGGTFRLRVQGYSTNASEVNASVLIGGVAGQNAAAGSIKNITLLNTNFTISITNTCVGSLGAYSVGGIVGESSGTIEDVALSKITIDCTESEGVTSYIGGMAGQLLVTESTGGAAMTSCTVSGSVKEGYSAPYGQISSVSYIGGIAGTVLDVTVADCRSAVSVYGTSQARTDVIYGTGGAFGRIRLASSYNFHDLIAYGSVLRAPQSSDDSEIMNYLGNFAGVVPYGQTWDADYANKNITVNTFNNDKYIGNAFNGNNPDNPEN